MSGSAIVPTFLSTNIAISFLEIGSTNHRYSPLQSNCTMVTEYENSIQNSHSKYFKKCLQTGIYLNT